MITVSDLIANAINSDSANYKVKLQLSGSGIDIPDSIDKFEFSQYILSDGLETIGNACSAQITFKINLPSVDLKNMSVDVRIGVLDADDTWQYVNFGKYKIYQTKHTGKEYTYTAYDAMSLELEKLYVSNLTLPTKDKLIINEIAGKLGLSVVFPDNFTQHTITKIQSGYTYRETLSYMAAMQGANAFIDCNTNKLTIKWFDEVNYTLTDHRIYMDKAEMDNDDIYSIDFVSIKSVNDNGETVLYEEGDTSKTGVSIQTPYMTESICTEIFNKIKDTEYRAFNIEMLGDIRLQVGDIITITSGNETFKSAIMHVTHKIDGGCQTIIECFASSETEVQTNFTNSIKKEMERYSIKLASVDEALVGKLDADTASITYATIDSLNVEKGRIDSLDANKADITFANIDTANIDKAHVAEMIANVGLITSAVISEGHVTGYLDSVEINANKITAGTITVDRLVVSYTDESGEIHYRLVTLDEGGELAYTTLNGDVIEEKTIRADHLVAHTITSNELTTENIAGSAGWINLAQGTFNFGNTNNSVLSWDGTNLYIKTASIYDNNGSDIVRNVNQLSLSQQGLESRLEAVEKQVDGSVTIYYADEEPTMDNYPADTWFEPIYPPASDAEADDNQFPSPEDMYNYIPYPYYHSTRTSNGITFTLNADGSIHVSGTATATAGFSLTARGTTNSLFSDLTVGKAYKLLGCPSIANNTCYLVLQYGNSSASKGTICYDKGSGGTFTMQTDYVGYNSQIMIQVANGATVDFTFYPMIVANDYTVRGYFKPQTWASSSLPEYASYTWIFTYESYQNHIGSVVYVDGSTNSYKFIKNESGDFEFFLIANSETAVLSNRISSLEQTVDGINYDIYNEEGIVGKQGLQISSNTTQIGIQAGQIASKVSATDYNGTNIVSKINQTASTVQIDAKNINLNGAITANGTFKIAIDGTMTATAGKIGGFSIKNGMLTNKTNSSSCVTIKPQAELETEKVISVDKYTSSGTATNMAYIDGNGHCKFNTANLGQILMGDAEIIPVPNGKINAGSAAEVGLWNTVHTLYITSGSETNIVMMYLSGSGSSATYRILSSSAIYCHYNMLTSGQISLSYGRGRLLITNNQTSGYIYYNIL